MAKFVTINTDDQDEEGVKIYADSTTVITVFDAISPKREVELATRIAKILKDEE